MSSIDPDTPKKFPWLISEIDILYIIHNITDNNNLKQQLDLDNDKD